jgi:apolipoprotein D and lipocalin family protein
MAVGFLGSMIPCSSGQALQTVPSVDLGRYSGRWYEVARYPNRFQEACLSDVTAEYVIRDANSLSVVNRCTTESGQTDKVVGIARVTDPQTNAKLEVRFAPAWLAWLPFVWGDYWIIDLAKNYTYAVVGEPSRRYLWILARKPRLSHGVHATITARLKAQGYDARRLIRTRHRKAAKELTE